MSLFYHIHCIDQSSTVPAEGLQRVVTNCKRLVDVHFGRVGVHRAARASAEE